MTDGNQEKENKALGTNPRPLIIAGLAIILVFFGGLAAWSAFLPFSGAVIAPGTVKVSQEKKTVQHLEGGIIDKIMVREGDVVEKGQPLIKLKRSEIDSQVSILQGQLWSKQGKAGRLRAESHMADDIEWPEALASESGRPEVAEIMLMEQAIFKGRRNALKGKISLHESQIEQLKEKVEGAQEEMAAQGEIIEMLREELGAKEMLLAEDYIDKAQILELQRRLSERKGRAGSLRQDIAETRKKIEELKLRIVNLKDTYQEEAVSELGEVQDMIFELRDQLRPKLDALERLTIRAPLAGEVMNLRIHSESSGVVRQGQPLLDIVPSRAELLVEARIEPDDITQVKKGQRVRVQLSAFNRRTTLPVMGEVIYISADQVTRETDSGERSFYVARTRVDEKDLEETDAYLSPGMPVVCYIETDERTILGYLLEPILQMMDRSLRES